jgi:hypothetical protein
LFAGVVGGGFAPTVGAVKFRPDIFGLALAAAGVLTPVVRFFVEPRPLDGPPIPPAVDAAAPETPDFGGDVRPVLERYCFECHDSETHKGGIVLDSFADTAGAAAELELWETVRQHVTLHVMPPKGKPAPTPDERRQLVTWIDRGIFARLAEHADPGQVTLRRLNRVEYQNTLRDLLGVELNVADKLPPDDAGYGFDNIGSALTLPPLVLEKYLAVTEEALDCAMTPQPPAPRIWKINPGDLRGAGSVTLDNRRLFLANGSALAVISLPHEGDYEVRLAAYGHQAGSEPARLRLSAGSEATNDLYVPGLHDRPTHLVTRFHLKSGGHALRIEFTNDFQDPAAIDPHRRDRNLIVVGMEIEGPFAPAPIIAPETHRRLFSEPVFADDTPAARRAAAARLLARFAAHAWRRPIDSDESQRLVKLFDAATAAGDGFENAVRVGLTAALTSPHFLFRAENRPGTPAADGLVWLDDFALASRLSYFLWSSMPDQALFEEAARGTLRRHVDRHVRRMIADPKARALTENFAGQWLQLRDLDHVAPDPRTFPQFTPELQVAMKRETEMLFEAAVRGEINVPALLDADFSFANETLARHYGLLGVHGDAFQRVSLAESPRRGLLGHGSILTLTSHAVRTSPTLRGKWVLENLLGMPPPPAPQDVPPIERAEVRDFHGSFRERLALHRESPACAGCHDAMDPPGFAMENFDAIGGWRETDDGQPIDASGGLITGERFTGAAGLSEVLSTTQRRAFLEHFARTLLTYALGRGLTHADRPAIDRILHDAERDDWSFAAFAMATARSLPFQARRSEPFRVSP